MDAEMIMSPGHVVMVPSFKDDDLMPLHANLQTLSAGINQMRHNIINVYQQQQLPECQNGLIMTLGNILIEYGIIQDKLISALKVWQRKQALAGNGAPPPNNLDGIQYIVETLLDCISDITLIINNLLHMGNEPILNEYLERAKTLFNILIVSTFVVEEQPLQVIKKETKKISVTVRWLIGAKLGIHLNNPVVQCEIIAEAVAKRLTVENIRMPPKCSGRMTGNKCTMEFNGNERKFLAKFSNVKINEVERFEKNGSENVTDNKYTLLFYTTTEYKGHAINCWAMSLPIVVVVHDNQASSSWATIMWDNAFSVIDRELFKVPERVHYTELVKALNMRFGYETGRNLTQDNLNVICNKLLVNDAGQVNEYISFSQLCKDKMPNSSFTFWEWFYATIKLTNNHLKQTWKGGHVVGFISKHETMEILAYQANGTFLLRFSDSTKGGISVAYRDDYGEIKMLEPWTKADLEIRSLADSIRDLDFLRIIYPTMKPSNEVFMQSPTPVRRATSNSDYVKNGIKRQIDTPSTSDEHQLSPQNSITVSTTVFDNTSMQSSQFENGLGSYNSQMSPLNSGTTVSDNTIMQNGQSFQAEIEHELPSFILETNNSWNWPAFDNSESTASENHFFRANSYPVAHQ